MTTETREYIHIENEQEVIQAAKEGCRDCIERLYFKFLPFLKKQALRLERYHRNVIYDDALQEGTVYLIDAIRTYDPVQGKSLKYWVATCVSLRLIDFWKSESVIRTPKAHDTDELKIVATKARNAKMFSDISRARCELRNERQFDVEDCAIGDPVEIASYREEKKILDSSLGKLSEFDRWLIRNRMDGKSYEECSQLLYEKNGKSGGSRENMRQKAAAALSRLENSICEEMNWGKDKIKSGSLYGSLYYVRNTTATKKAKSCPKNHRRYCTKNA